MVNAAAQLKINKPLGTKANPFDGAGARRPGNPVQATLGEVMRRIERRCPMVVVVGKAGTGKTLLMEMIARACGDIRLSARQIDRGDMTYTAPNTPSDVLLVDEADWVPSAHMHRLPPPEGDGAATTRVFLRRPSALHRFNCPAANVVELHDLSITDARTYLLERANSIGRPDLFATPAMDLIIDRAGGSWRSLRSIASLAFSTAAWEGESQISARHVAEALASQMISVPLDHDTVAQLNVSNDARAGQADAKPLPGPNSEFHGRESVANPLKELALLRTARLARIAVGIVAFIGLASAASSLFLSTNDSAAGRNSLVGAAAVPEAFDAAIDQTLAVDANDTADQTASASDAAGPAAAATAKPKTLAVAPASPSDQTNLVSGAAQPPATANPTARRQTAVSRNVDPRTSGRTALRSGSPIPVKARLAGPAKTVSPPARATTQRIAAQQVAAEAAERAREADERARQAEEAARQAEAAQREAASAARRADDAVRQAAEAVRQAEEAARQAETVARQANLGMRIILRSPLQRR